MSNNSRYQIPSAILPLLRQANIGTVRFQLFSSGCLFLLFSFLLISFDGYAQKDTVRRQKLQEVEIVGKERPLESSAPIQVIRNQDLKTLPTLQLSDALKFMSGIVIKDYGGVGGMKTVAVRGLGSQHTGVAYDGIAMTDCQTGQIDLSKISTDNIKSISLQSGREDDIFVPARLFASASLINIVSQEPTFKDKKPVNLHFTFTGGSFALINPYLLLENRIKKQQDAEDSYYAWSLKINYLQSKGDYPFDLHYGHGENDSVSHERRSNSDVRTIQTEANFYAQFNSKSKLNFKIYYYYSARGLPGATIYYNLDAKQRLDNQNAFGQLHFEHHFTDKVAYQCNAKFNYDQTYYLDPHYHNLEGKLENTYIQREYYLSNGVLYKPFRQWQLTLFNDMFYNNMNANLRDFANPGRFNCLTVLATTFNSKYISISANLLHTYVFNHVERGEAAKNENHLSPSAGISITPLGKRDFTIRLLYKNIFRMPSFNDLYYREVGNIKLNPEKTNQFNAGLTYDKSWLGRIMLNASVDVYYNIVKDKIVAIPNRNLFVWTMLNYGIVDVLGTDVNLQFSYRVVKQLTIHIMGAYSYQRALDMTDPDSKTYGHQIPYTPFHSGSAAINFQTPWFTVGYTVVASGIRYALGQNIPANQLDPYADQSVFIGHDFNIKDKVTLGFKAELLNLANAQYEIVRNYPMQGRSFRIKLMLKY